MVVGETRGGPRPIAQDRHGIAKVRRGSSSVKDGGATQGTSLVGCRGHSGHPVEEMAGIQTEGRGTRPQ